MNVEGAKSLSKADQKQIMGGWPKLIQCCDPAAQCCVTGAASDPCHYGTGSSGCSYLFPANSNPCCI